MSVHVSANLGGIRAKLLDKCIEVKMISIVRQRLLNSLKNKNRSFISKRMKSTSTTTTTNGEPAAEKTPDELANDLQKDAFKNENCFLVNESDQIIGNASKAECHKVRPDGTILLHRAFSVFMFNSDGHLLLQKRSPFKVSLYPCREPQISVKK